MSHPAPDELIVFLDEEPVARREETRASWRVLVVDDDPEVFEATRFAISDAEVLGRRLELTGVHSAAEAEAFLRDNPDVAVILLDVVMESEDAGLRLVHRIREDLGLTRPRIILRTGQPGYAPELEVISQYDINDYRTKSELTRTRLLTSLIAALRGYQQIEAIETNRDGLHKVVDATRDLLSRNGLTHFTAGVMAQIAAMYGTAVEGLIVVTEMPCAASPTIKSGTGKFERYIDQPLSALDDPDLRTTLGEILRNRSSDFDAGDGSYFYFAGRHCPIVAYVSTPKNKLNADPEVLNLFCQNIALASDNLALIEKLQQQAYFDDLSALPNRLHFIEDAEVRLHDADEPQGLGVVDIDHFNAVVENTGPEVGDKLIAMMASRIRETFEPAGVTVARIAGDSFGLVGARARITGDRIQGVYSEPFEVDGLRVPLTATLGLAPLGGDCPTVPAAMSGAYTALKLAKQKQRGGCAYYTSEVSEQQRQRIDILNGLRDAIANDELFLTFQPQLRLSDRTVLASEALLRWRRPDGRMIPPNVFIAVAEGAGIIVPIGDWVLDRACHELRRLRDLGFTDLIMAINVSVAQLRDPDFVTKVVDAIERHGVPADKVNLEVTETEAMDEINHVMEIFDALKQLGIRISLDDFGTGFSSLAYLRRLQLDQLKIDRAFVDSLGREVRSGQIAETILQLGRTLGLQVVAEGIETEVQAEFLREMGCDVGQGFLYAKPLEFDAFVAWMQQG